MALLLRITLILSLAVLLLTGVAVAIVLGVAHSEPGTRWLASQAASWADGVIEWQGVEGSLFGPLQLKAVRIFQPGLDMTVQSLSLDWQPAALLQGQLQIVSLNAQGIRIVLAPTEASTEEDPFDPSSLELPVDISVRGIRLKDLQLVQRGQPVQIVDEVEIDAQLHNGELTIEQLTVVLAGMSLDLQGKLSFAEDANPVFDVAAQWAGLQWPLAASEPDVFSAQGKILLSGSANDYKLKLAAQLAGKQIPQSQWSGEGRGDLSRLELIQLRGQLLGGNLAISGPVEWDPLPRWELSLVGSALNPGHINPEFPGQLSITAHSTGQFDPRQGIQAVVDLEQLRGTLMGYPIDLNARASLAGEQVQLDALQLESQGNQIRVSGQLSADVLTLDWQLEAPAPGALFPGSSGVVSGRGNVAGSPEAPRLQAQLQGKLLRWETLAIPTLNATLVAGLGADDELSVDVVTGSVKDGGQVLLKSLALQLSGTTSSHTLGIELTRASEQLSARLEGGLNHPLDAWQGRVTQLDAQSQDHGSWHLPRASTLSLAAHTITLANTCLKNESSQAQLCAQASWHAPGDSELKVELKALPIESVNPVISGVLEGKMKAGLAADGAIVASASFALTPGLVQVELGQDERQLPHGGGRLDLSIGSKGLSATLDFAAPEQGQVKANLILPALNVWPLVDKQPLSGRLFASLPDLSAVATWIPEVSNTEGRLEADIELAGTLEHPEFLGKVALTNGAADIPMAGLKLHQMELNALSSPLKPGLLDLSGGMESGRGHMVLSGQFDIAGSSFALALKGDQLQVYNTQDARVLLSPDLNISWSDEGLKLRGRVLVPRADITPRLEISPSMAFQNKDATETTGQFIGPSPDVEVLNAPQDAIDRPRPAAPPFSIDSQVELVLGDAVNVNTLGFISQVTGAVTFTNSPGQAEMIPMARGRLSLDDGTFRAFGQDLVIETGQLIFADVPATEPELNVRAVRWIDNDSEVTAAGVLVTGSVAEPALELFSRPQLEASEIQSYLLTGRSSGDKNNVLSVGTYLTRRLYVGYGYNLIEKTNEFNSLFSITPRYGIGANLGEADNNINLTLTYEN